MVYLDSADNTFFARFLIRAYPMLPLFYRREFALAHGARPLLSAAQTQREGDRGLLVDQLFPAAGQHTRSLFRIAKSRWEIENQGFNEAKNQHALEHIPHHHENRLLVEWLLNPVALTIERLYRLRTCIVDPIVGSARSNFVACFG